MKNIIEALQRWYSSQCDDTWEHSNGVKISTIDNPGWHVEMRCLSSKKELDLRIDRDEEERDWIVVKATESKFTGYDNAKHF
ncbi:MAG: immunity 53 family protein [Zoogloeaceae bacterium]|jgi:hypothetical protein|nr:immunity 53 family protein [Zoogloeaceae bacterium]